MTAHTFTRDQVTALALLARGGARYGTQHAAMTELKNMGLCYAHDKGAFRAPGTWGSRKQIGRWTWRPTDKGRKVIAELFSPTQESPQ